MLKLTKEENDFIEDVANLNLITKSSVKQVLEAIVTTWLVNLAEDEKKNTQILIPFLGKILVRKDGFSVVDGEVETTVEPFLSINHDFKKQLYNCLNDNYDDLTKDSILKIIK